MKEIITKVYELKELNDKAKAKAIEWWRAISQDDSFWFDCIQEDVTSLFKLCGWSIDRILYSGFWSQGDGACFEGTWKASDVDLDKLKQNAPNEDELHAICQELIHLQILYPFAYAKVRHRGHYYHEHCTEFDVSIVDAEENEINTDAVISDEKHFIYLSKELMRWIYNRLEKEYDYQNSDEVITEAIEANGYTFTETGKRFG